MLQSKASSVCVIGTSCIYIASSNAYACCAFTFVNHII